MIPVKELLKQWEKGTLVATAPPQEDVIPQSKRIVLSDLDTGWHPLVAQAVATARNWAREKRNWLDRNKNKPRDYDYHEAGDPAPGLVMVATQCYLGNGKRDVERTGYGCGKTHIAEAVLWSSYHHVDGKPVAPTGKFFMADDLIKTLGRKDYADGSTHSSSCHRLVRTGEVLIIDDVGTEEEIAWVNSAKQEKELHARYFKMINYCCKRGVSVIITGNLSLSDLEQRLGGRAWSRLLEMAPKGFMLDMTGVPDYRRMKGGR